MRNGWNLVACLACALASGCGGTVIGSTCGPGTVQEGDQCVAEPSVGHGAAAGSGGGSATSGSAAGGPGGGGTGSGGTGSGGAGNGGKCSDPDRLASGELAIGPTDAVIALCDGRVLVGDKVENRVELLDVSSGAIERSWQLSSAPGDIAYDDVTNTAYAVLVSASYLAKIDLTSDSVEQIALDGPAVRLALGDGGRVFAALGDSGTWAVRSIAVVNGPASSVDATLVGDYEFLLAYDRPGSQLITGSDHSLSRYAFDPVATTLTHLQERLGVGGNCRNIAISPDGNHVALPCGGGNGAGYTIFDFSSDDLDVTFGEWNIGAYPVAAVFSADGRELLANNGSELLLFDASTHAVIETLSTSTSGCSYHDSERVAMSPSGRILYMVSNCGFERDSGLLTWFVR